MKKSLVFLLFTCFLLFSLQIVHASNEPTRLTIVPKKGQPTVYEFSSKPIISFLKDCLVVTVGDSKIEFPFADVKRIDMSQIENPPSYIPSTGTSGGSTQWVTVTPDPRPVPEIPTPPVEQYVIDETTEVSFNQDEYTFTGRDIFPTCVVKFNGTVLVQGTDYNITYKDNVNAGLGSVIITGMGKYSGSVTKTFVIALKQSVSAYINGEEVVASIGEVSGNAAQALFDSEYGSVLVSNCYALKDSIVTITVTPKNGYSIMKEHISPLLNGDDPINSHLPREYTYKISAFGYLVLDAVFSKSIDISSAVLALSSTSPYYYIGDSIKPACTLTLNGKELIAGTDFTLKYSNNVNAGEATITADGKGEFSGIVSTTFNIEKVRLTIAANQVTRVYGDENPELTYNISGFVGNDDVSCLATKPSVNTEATKESPVGDYPINISGGEAQNYDFTYEEGAKLTVTKAMLTVKADDKAKVYGEELPELPCQISGFVNNETVDVLTTHPVVTADATATSPVGEYAITVSGGEAQNYDFTYEEGAKLTVTKAILTVKADAKTMVYGEKLPDLTCQIEGFVNDESSDVLTKQPVLTTEATAISAVGEYAITVGDAEATNYEFTYENAVLTITPRSIVDAIVTMTLDSFAYTGQPVIPEVTVQCGSSTLVEGTDYILTASNNTEPGTAMLTVEGQGNYEGQIDTTFVIYLKPSVEVFINDVAVEPVIGSLMNYSAPATFETEQGIIKVDNYYALAKNVVTIDVTPKEFYYIRKDSISGIELYDEDPEELKDLRSYRYYVPDSGIVVLRAVFSLDSIALGICDRYIGDLTFEVVDGQIVRVLGAREAAPVSVFDARGQLVAAEVVRSERELIVRLSRQPQGLYIIKVNNNSFKVYRK